MTILTLEALLLQGFEHIYWIWSHGFRI